MGNDYTEYKKHPLFDTLEIAGEPFNVLLSSEEAHAIYIYKRSVFHNPNQHIISKEIFISERISHKCFCDIKIFNLLNSAAEIRRKGFFSESDEEEEKGKGIGKEESSITTTKPHPPTNKKMKKEKKMQINKEAVNSSNATDNIKETDSREMFAKAEDNINEMLHNYSQVAKSSFFSKIESLEDKLLARMKRELFDDDDGETYFYE
jgi:hypothetical protein